MDVLSQIKDFKPKSLKKVDTQITTVEGKKFVEKHDSASGETVLIVGKAALGFCPDFSPDNTVGVATDGVFVSSQDVAHDFGILKNLGVTHILNVACGVPNAFPDDFVYLSEEMFDDDQENILTHYGKCESFIDAAKQSQGAVLVHCNAGRSRSSSIALAYILHKEKTSLDTALKKLRETRPVAKPSGNFMKQLKEMEKRLGIVPAAVK